MGRQKLTDKRRGRDCQRSRGGVRLNDDVMFIWLKGGQFLTLLYGHEWN
jgi:hypothetical protein